MDVWRRRHWSRRLITAAPLIAVPLYRLRRKRNSQCKLRQNSALRFIKKNICRTSEFWHRLSLQTIYKQHIAGLFLCWILNLLRKVKMKAAALGERPTANVVAPTPLAEKGQTWPRYEPETPWSLWNLMPSFGKAKSWIYFYFFAKEFTKLPFVFNQRGK